jgi:hypothetical protein
MCLEFDLSVVSSSPKEALLKSTLGASAQAHETGLPEDVGTPIRDFDSKAARLTSHRTQLSLKLDQMDSKLTVLLAIFTQVAWKFTQVELKMT